MTARDRVAANRRALTVLEDRVEGLTARADAEAAAWAQIAGDYAWHSPSGVWASPAIDSAMERIGLRVCPRTGSSDRSAGPRQVLHVATECAAVGGHSRMAWRWIERDTGSVPTLALTRHRGAIPDPLADAVAARGGRIEVVEGHDQIDRARELARLIDAADIVVLHVHPFDVVSAIALADRRGRPPVLLVNHADHCFWLGAGVPDLVVSTRHAAARSTATRRGIPAERSALLAVPADPPVALPERDRARRDLGLPQDVTVLVAMASAYKLERIDDVGFLDLMEPIVASRPDLVLVAVGPDDEGAWRAARERTGGRIRAIGVLSDTSTALAAGDVFLDGYPCSSLTAALEAAAVGMPVVSFQPPRPQAATYDIDEPALGDGHLRATSAAGLAAVIGHLADDPAALAHASQAARDASALMREPRAWTETLEGVYARAAELATGVAPALTAIAPPTDDTEGEDAFLLALHEASGMAISDRDAVVRNGDVFARDPRAGLAVVIHTRDDVEGLQRLLASAVATCAGIESVEAVIIDDGSRDGTDRWLAGLGGDVRVVRNPTPIGPGASWPLAVDLAEGQVALLVTSDVELTPGWLTPLVDAMRRPGITAVGPRIEGGTGREICVLASLGALRNGAAILPIEVPESRVLGAAATPPLEVAR